MLDPIARRHLRLLKLGAVLFAIALVVGLVVRWCHA